MRETVQTVVFIGLLGAAAVSDLKKRIIPDWVNCMIALTSLLCFSPEKLLGILAALPFLLAAMQGGMGGGDVKLIAASGLVLGFHRTMFGCITGLCVMLCFAAGSVGVCRHRKAYPMAPFLMAGFLATYLL